MGGVEFVVWGPVARADVPGLCERFGAAVAAGGGPVVVDVRALDYTAAAASPERVAWWCERVVSCHAYLADPRVARP